MGDIIRRLAWFFFVSCACAYAIFLFAGSSIDADAINTAHIITVRDDLQPGVHHLAGMVMVPRTCAEVSVDVNYISSSTFELAFKTWDEPSVTCVTDDTPRSFRATAFGPAAGIQFTASLDDQPLTVVVDQEPMLQQ